MKESNFSFWQKWLTYANVLTVLVGMSVAFLGDSLIWELHNDGSKEVFFSGEFPMEVVPFKKWLFGIIGGTIVGFHVLCIFISENAFKKKEPWAYWALWIGLLSWFAIDTGISLFYGAMHNVYLVNLVALFLIGLPLLMTAKAFRL